MKNLIYNLFSLCFKICFYAMFFLVSILSLPAQTQEKKIDELLPVRGFSISVPSPEGVDNFLRFVEEELAPAHFNLLILLVNWRYAYETHPELCSENPLTKADVKRIVAVCRKHGIEIAPSINLLGHQSWEKTTVWSGNSPFLKGYYGTGETSPEAATVKQLMEAYKNL